MGPAPRGSQPGLMDGGRLSDFSIERILSPQLGHSWAEPGQQLHGRLGADTGGLRAPPPPPPPPLLLLHHRGLGLEDQCFHCLHHPDFSFYSPSGGPLHLSGPQEAPDAPLAGYHGYHAAATPAQAQLRQRVRVRTVFTDAQVRQLEALFDLTDYPPAEARAELARSSGLSEETVRVWFKNRRARRKQQRSGSRVKSSSSPCGS